MLSIHYTLTNLQKNHKCLILLISEKEKFLDSDEILMIKTT